MIPEDLLADTAFLSNTSETSKSLLSKPEKQQPVQEQEHQKERLNINETIFRSSKFCGGAYHKSVLNTVGRFKYHNGVWRAPTNDDVQYLNNALLSSCLNPCSVNIPEILCRFFPDNPLVSKAVSVLSLNCTQLAALRGHPVTVQFGPCSSGTEHGTNQFLNLETSSILSSSSDADMIVNNNCDGGTALAKSPLEQQSSSNVSTSMVTTPSMVQESCPNSNNHFNNGRSVALAAVTTVEDEQGKGLPSSTTTNSSFSATTTTTTVNNDVSASSSLHGIFSEDSVRTATLVPNNSKTVCDGHSFHITFEFSAGLCVLRPRHYKDIKKNNNRSTNFNRNPLDQQQWEVLVIRRFGDSFYEVPKGHLERGETLQQAAERELREETGLLNKVTIDAPLLSEMYTGRTANHIPVEKTVHYFSAELQDCDSELLDHNGNCESMNVWCTDDDATAHLNNITTPQYIVSKEEHQEQNEERQQQQQHAAWFGAKEGQTREVRWVTLKEAQEMYWKSNTVSYVVAAALRQRINHTMHI